MAGPVRRDPEGIIGMMEGHQRCQGYRALKYGEGWVLRVGGIRGASQAAGRIGSLQTDLRRLLGHPSRGWPST